MAKDNANTSNEASSARAKSEAPSPKVTQARRETRSLLALLTTPGPQRVEIGRRDARATIVVDGNGVAKVVGRRR